VRPNQALGGKTPAEVAGVDLKLEENTGLGLLASFIAPLLIGRRLL
jgi:hypothetical protein